MTTHSERKLEKLLTGTPVPEPPAELRDRLLEEIPEEITLHPDLGEGRVVPFPSRRTWRLAAAAVLTLALTAAVTWRLHEQRPGPSEDTMARFAETVATDEHARRQAAPDERALGREMDEAASSPLDSDRPVEPPTTPANAPPPTGPARTTTDTDDDATFGATDGTDTDSGAQPAGERSAETAATSNALPLHLADEARRSPSTQVHETTAELRRKVERERPPSPDVGPAAAKATTSTEPLTDAAPRDLQQPPQGLRQAPEQTFSSEISVTSPAPPVQVLESMAATVVDAPGMAMARDERRRSSVAPESEGFLEAPAPSTGGTAEPNDAPYGDVFFKGYGVNPFVDTSDDPLSTFALEVDTASSTVVRRYLEDGHLPPHDAVRVEEMVNAFAYHDPPPSEGDVRLVLEGAPSPYTENDHYRVLRAAVRFRDVARTARPPAVLTFVVDASGSMAREDRLGLVQRALASLLANLERDDRVGLVVYGSTGQVLLAPTADHDAVRRALDRLTPSGSTNAEEGLVLGYRLADEHYLTGGINRVVLCSDGVANVGRTGPDSILERIRAEAGRGIELTTVGFGMGNYNDVLMERLADAGDGRYAYVDTFDEARRLFVEELTGTLFTVAHDAKAQLELDPAVVSRWRLLGYENRDVADERFRDPTVDAGEIGAGHTAVAVYEVKLTEGAPRGAAVATLRVRYRPGGADDEVEVRTDLTTDGLAPSWQRARPSLRLAATVAELAELLRGSYWARGGSFVAVSRELDRLAAELDDPRVAETAGLARTAARLAGETEPRGERD